MVRGRGRWSFVCFLYDVEEGLAFATCDALFRVIARCGTECQVDWLLLQAS